MWLDDLLADSPTAPKAEAIANAETRRDVPVQLRQSDEPAKDITGHDTLLAAGDSDRSPSVRSAVRTESAVSGRSHHTAFTVTLPARAPFGVSCPQGFDAVREQWPTAISIIPS
jgi:hypothetical protein